MHLFVYLHQAGRGAGSWVRREPGDDVPEEYASLVVVVVMAGAAVVDCAGVHRPLHLVAASDCLPEARDWPCLCFSSW